MHGVLLVLLTWAVLIMGLAALGFGLVSGTSTQDSRWSTVRTALWWGLAVAFIVILVTNIFTPLRSAAAAWVMVAAVALLGLYSWVRWRRARGLVTPSEKSISIWAVLLLLTLVAATLYFAVAALGPVTNYDSGLYHLGAVKYSGDYATVPGLANLYFPFGYNNALFPFGAFLGNGPWAGEGYRLANGLILLLLMIDLGIRWTRGRRTVGAYVLLVGSVAALIPMITFSDYWVTSPTSDSCVLVLTLVCNAYLADAIWHRHDRTRNGATAFVLAVLLVSLRPLMGFFLAGLVLVLVIRYLRTRSAHLGKPDPGGRAIWITATVLAVAMAAVQSVRDYVLSGWLQFPLSVHSFNVPWLAPDPAVFRAATLGAARDPQHLWQAAGGWDWIPTWLSRLPSQWETYEFILAMGTAVAALIVVNRYGRLRMRALGLALVPSAVTSVAWFTVSPPAFRFAWGPVFSLAVLPLGCALFVMSESSIKSRLTRQVNPVVLIASAAVVMGVIGYSAVMRLHPGGDTEAHAWAIGPVSTTVWLAPIPDPATRSPRLNSGLSVRFPIATDQCWNVYPLCTAQLETTVRMRGATLQDGFLP